MAKDKVQREDEVDDDPQGVWLPPDPSDNDKNETQPSGENPNDPQLSEPLLLVESDTGESPSEKSFENYEKPEETA